MTNLTYFCQNFLWPQNRRFPDSAEPFDTVNIWNKGLLNRNIELPKLSVSAIRRIKVSVNDFEASGVPVDGKTVLGTEFP